MLKKESLTNKYRVVLSNWEKLVKVAKVVGHFPEKIRGSTNQSVSKNTTGNFHFLITKTQRRHQGKTFEDFIKTQIKKERTSRFNYTSRLAYAYLIHQKSITIVFICN